MDSVFVKVPVSERLPEKKDRSEYLTDRGLLRLDGEKWLSWWQGDQYTQENPKWWLEEYTLETIHDKRELTATFLVNSIRLLDEQGARHLVKELCERFHLLPSDEEILQAVLIKQEKDQTQFMRGIDFILNTLKGEKR